MAREIIEIEYNADTRSIVGDINKKIKPAILQTIKNVGFIAISGIYKFDVTIGKTEVSIFFLGDLSEFKKFIFFTRDGFRTKRYTIRYRTIEELNAGFAAISEGL